MLKQQSGLNLTQIMALFTLRGKLTHVMVNNLKRDRKVWQVCVRVCPIHSPGAE